MNYQDAIEYFTTCGCSDPQYCAEQEAIGDESYIAIHEIIRLLHVQKDGISNRILERATIAKKIPQLSPEASIFQEAALLKRIIDAGIKKEELDLLLQSIEKISNFSFAAIIDGITGKKGLERKSRWKLFEVDENEQPIKPVAMLHDHMN